MPLSRDGLRGGFQYWDAQVDDYALVRPSSLRRSRKARRCAKRRASIVASPQREASGSSRTGGGEERFDFVVNAAGPWMNALLAENRIRSRYRLSLVRGSHLVLKRRVAEAGCCCSRSSDRRVFFVLPWKGTTLVGTTEVMHSGSLENVQATDEEIDYLIARFNRYVREPIGRDDIASTFAGVRPLVGRSTNPSAHRPRLPAGAPRQSAQRLRRQDDHVPVAGGKAAMRVDNYFGHVRTARAPRVRWKQWISGSVD